MNDNTPAAAIDQDGDTWDTAYRYLDDALAAVSTPELTQIWIAEGLYIPGQTNGSTSTAQTVTFTFQSGLEVYGGFDGSESAVGDRTGAAALTLLSGDLRRDGNDPSNCYHVVTVTSGDEEVRIDRLTIRDGEADGAPSASDVDGGGIHVDGSDLRLVEVRLTENSASEKGGAIYFEGDTGSNVGAGFRAVRCDFSLNDAGDLGGAIHFEALGIPAESSAGILIDEPSWLFNCTFDRNSGGATYATSGVGGGAINVEDRIDRTPFVVPSEDYTTFDEAAPQEQSWTLELANCAFKGNITDGLGSSMRIVPASTTDGRRIVIRQCTMAGDSVTSEETNPDNATIFLTGTELGPTGSEPPHAVRTTLMFASIVMAPNALPTTTSNMNAIDGASGTIASTVGVYDPNALCAYDSNVQQASGADLHTNSPSVNLNTDPEFVNFGIGNLRLASTSPCIDEGLSASSVAIPLDYPDLDDSSLTTRLPLDLDDQTRAVDSGGGTVTDMGAYEYDGN